MIFGKSLILMEMESSTSIYPNLPSPSQNIDRRRFHRNFAVNKVVLEASRGQCDYVENCPRPLNLAANNLDVTGGGKCTYYIEVRN